MHKLQNEKLVYFIRTEKINKYDVLINHDKLLFIYL